MGNFSIMVAALQREMQTLIALKSYISEKSKSQ
jgi:hypothetical protein